MARQAKKDKAELETIWKTPDHLWEKVKPVIEELDPPNATGRKRADPRQMLDGILFRLRSGCQWNRLPKDLGDDSTIHRTFQRWEKLGVFQRIWEVLAAECADLGGVHWEWQSADCSMGKARSGGDAIGPNPTDRGKPGSKRSILVDGDGGPLSIVLSGANVHDTKLLAETLDSVVVACPAYAVSIVPHLCLDKGYDNRTGHRTVAERQYQPHIRRIGEEKLAPDGKKRYPARRWVVERTLGWLSKCRGILVRYEKRACNYLALLQLACALQWYRRQWRMLF